MSHYTIRSSAILTAALALAISGCAAAGDTSADSQSTVALASETSSATTAPHEDTSGTDQSQGSATDTMSDSDEDHASQADDDHGETSASNHSDEALAAGEGDRVVTIVMTELAFSPASLEVTAGETITFDIQNEGTIVHEFRLSNDHRIEEHIAEGHQGHGGDGHHGDEDGDVYLELQAGESGTLTVTFPTDTTVYTEVACLIPGHYEAGMRGDLTYV